MTNTSPNNIIVPINEPNLPKRIRKIVADRCVSPFILPRAKFLSSLGRGSFLYRETLRRSNLWVHLGALVPAQRLPRNRNRCQRGLTKPCTKSHLFFTPKFHTIYNTKYKDVHDDTCPWLYSEQFAVFLVSLHLCISARPSKTCF